MSERGSALIETCDCAFYALQAKIPRFDKED